MSLPYRVATLLYAFDPAGRVLLLQRAKPPNAGLWSPPGGKLQTHLGESPHDCARREALEELGLHLQPSDLHLTGVVSEAGFQGQAHWLMFLFEILPRLPASPPDFEEGKFAFHPPHLLHTLPLPETDRQFLWPNFWKHRGGFFAAHASCSPTQPTTWTLLQSLPLPETHPPDPPPHPDSPHHPHPLIDLESDHFFLGEALRQAVRAFDSGEVPVGAIITHRQRIIARAANQVELLKDATAHAEILAITQAESALGDWRLNECTLYVTKEPCPMCAGAIVHARLRRVVFGAHDPKAGCAGGALNLLQFPSFNHRCEVSGGLREPECRSLLREFFAQQRALKDPSPPKP